MAKEMIIVKNVSINKSTREVFDFLKETKNQDRFSVWNMKDPKMKKSYSGIDGTTGFIYSWDSKDKNVGAGSQEITNINEGNRIDFEMRFIRPMQNTATASFVLDKIDENTTSVTWTFKSPTKFPMSLFTPILKNILGKQLEQGLQQAFDEYQFYSKKIEECDKRISEVLKALTKDKEEPQAKPTKKRIYHNPPQVDDLDKMMMQLFDGKDLTILPGMTSYSLLKLYAQVGNKWGSFNGEKGVTAWAGLAPSKYQSGKTRKYKKIKVNTTVGQILKECVQPLLKSKNNALGAFGRRIAARRGPSVAIKAMARKLLCWIYRIMTKGLQFVENGIEQYHKRQEEKTLKWLEQQAAKLNLKLSPV